MQRPSAAMLPLLLLVFQCTLHHGFSKLLAHMGYKDIEDYKDHPCTRPCNSEEAPMICDYNFLIERYHTLTKACWDCPHNLTDCSRPHCVAADGGLRGILTANRMMPGPGIHVCEGDTIRVRVHNKVENAEGVSLHWHGVLQRGTPHMDGVAMVTQCPIPAHTAFTYVFKADPPGTHFWHAHSGLQRGDGLYGNLVVRRFPEREPHYHLYDLDLPEHTLVVHDWENREMASVFAQHHHSDGSNKPASMLINGKGFFHRVHNKKTGANSTTPREVFEVTQGSRYRFRVASNGIQNCPIKISVDDHVLEVIASDGYSVEPVRVQYFNVFGGERVDFVLLANESIGNYLLRAQGELDCGPLFKNAHQTAILHYDGASRDLHYWQTPPAMNGKGLNTINSRGSETVMSIKDLRGLPGDASNDPSLQRVPDHKIVLAMDFHVINNPRFHNKEFYSVDEFPIGTMNLQTPQINNISNMLPPSPALTQLDNIPEEMFCKNETVQGRNCGTDLCECVHLYRVGLGDVVELVLVDQGNIWDTANHPMHMHGHGFRVIAMDRMSSSVHHEDVTSLDARLGIARNFDRPPMKDTVTVPDGGYTIVRFHADNPGMWLFHCHVEFHVEIGMAVLFQVGDVAQFPPVPRGFPKCGDWSPTDEPDISSDPNGCHTSRDSGSRLAVVAWCREMVAFLPMIVVGLNRMLLKLVL